MRKFIDIGANLTDKVFNGCYRGKQVHLDDFHDVLKRGWDVGVEKIMVTAGCHTDVLEALALVKEDERLYCTVGVHPTRCNEFDKSGDPENHLSVLSTLIENNRPKVVALGEMGLDYDRTQFCSIETQQKYFELQLNLAEQTKLPLFLHSRNCADDFIDIVKRNKSKISGGVIHSFTGTADEAKIYLDLGFYIGINGCSLKTEDNLEAMACIPTDRLMLETDAPWCGIKNTHAGSKHIRSRWEVKKKERWVGGCTVKDRNEPCHIAQVLEVVAEYRQEEMDTLAQTIYQNTLDLFFA